MYADPSLIRKHVAKISFNDNEAALMKALVAYTGQQPAALYRDLLLEQARSLLCANGASGGGGMEAPQLALFGN